MGKRKNQKTPQLVEHMSDDDSDDEEIDEDEAFNSDDERKYGSFFNKSSERTADGDSGEDEKGSDDDDDDDDSASEDDNSVDGDSGQYMLDLLDKLDDKKDDKARDDSNTTRIAHHVKESQFSSSVIPKDDLTLDSLMEGLKNTKGFGDVQKSMKKVAQGQATAAPVAKVVSDRAQRKVHFESQSKEVSQWLEAVQQNRQAETLDFRPKQRLEVTKEVLVDKFTPTTDFEKQLYAALQEAGQQDEEALLKAEEAALQDDLGANQVTLEEYKRRRSQLAKMRALMFYQEQKRHHINKIKSKKYRRIRKKQRERLKDSEAEALLEENPDYERELEEKEEMERMKERMTLAHKNTSKWAKRILKRGKNVDSDTRRALSAQLKRGDDLLKRMKTSGEDEDDDSDEDLLEAARKVLADTEPDEDAVQGKGLFKLSFMQRGIERQREQARQEARQLLLELEANEEIENGSGDEHDDGDQPERKRRKALKSASKEEMKHVLKEGDMVSTLLRFGQSNTTQVTGGISIDIEPGLSERSEKKATTSEYTSTMEASPTMKSDKANSGSTEESKPKKKKTKKVDVASAGQEESNPWLIGQADKATSPAANNTTVSTSKRGKKSKINVDIDRAIDLLADDNQHQRSDEHKSNDDVDSTADDSKKKITTLTQEELVARAFAGPNAQHAAEEFAREKEQVAEQEDPNHKKRRRGGEDTDKGGKNLGWGCWAGQGAPPPKPPRKLPKKLQPPKELPKRKRQDQAKPAVIISERRVKRLADQFMVSEIPYPFTSRDEYERAMAGALGREWNVTSSFHDMTRPEVMTRAGKIIQPLSKKVKKHRPAAKF